jgi:two-component system, OmpR family, phosphate regulon sensor histidine kinase PhoR
LIISSITLLLIFQGLWMRKLYTEQKENLRKEADNLFQRMMTHLQDSLVEKAIEPAFPQEKIKFKIQRRFDTLAPISQMRIDLSKRTSLKRDSNKIFITKKPDSNEKSTNIEQLRQKISTDILPNAQIQVFVGASPQHDSLGKIAGNIMKEVIAKPQVNDFIIRLNYDSIPNQDVLRLYQKVINQARIEAKVQTIRITQSAPKIDLNVIATQEFRCFPFLGGSRFYAQLSDYQWFIFKKLIPQLLFSLFLLGITTWAFYWIYRSMRQQQRLAELKNDFISNVTHELKTPVTTVSVAIEALQNFQAIQNPQLTEEYLEISKNELKRLAILIDKILKTAVFDKKGVELKLENLDLSTAIQQVLASLKLQFEKYQAEINFYTEGNDFQLLGDSVHLTNVIYNLLDNALKYSPQNPKITLFLKELPQQIALTIQDNGMGISAENQKKIFEKFFRVPTGDVHNTKGYGLGLSYARSVVEQLGGKIEVSSEIGKGSRFTVYLPKK